MKSVVVGVGLRGVDVFFERPNPEQLTMLTDEARGLFGSSVCVGLSPRRKMATSSAVLTPTDPTRRHTSHQRVTTW